jgi:hypothetical protein
MQIYNLSVKKALQLLDEGYTLTTATANPSRLSKTEDGNFKWNASNDRKPTILERESITDTIIKNYRWRVAML